MLDVIHFCNQLGMYWAHVERFLCETCLGSLQLCVSTPVPAPDLFKTTNTVCPKVGQNFNQKPSTLAHLDTECRGYLLEVSGPPMVQKMFCDLMGREERHTLYRFCLQKNGLCRFYSVERFEMSLRYKHMNMLKLTIFYYKRWKLIVHSKRKGRINYSLSFTTNRKYSLDLDFNKTLLWIF